MSELNIIVFFWGAGEYIGVGRGGDSHPSYHEPSVCLSIMSGLNINFCFFYEGRKGERGCSTHPKNINLKCTYNHARTKHFERTII